MANRRIEDKKKKPSPVGGTTAFDNAQNASHDETSVSHSTKKSTGHKKRNWACVIYPESLPKNWLDILRATGLQIAISPLHDKDLEADGQTPKKSHYHVILVYAGPTSFSVVKILTDKLNAPIPVPLEAVRGYYRYFTHKDNPEKYQYDEKDIQCLNGFSILDFVELTKTEVNEIKKSLQVLIRTQDMHEYCVFMDYVLENLSDSEYDVASGHTYFFDKYLSSRRFSSSKNLALEALTNQE